MKLLYVLVPTLGLVACASQHPEPVANIGDFALPDTDAIREPSRIHTYLVNDYVDPNNPRLRHRGHLVDVVEQDEKWNLAPTDTTETNLGPVTAVNDPNAAPNPYSAEFETELVQQRDQYQQLADLGTKMTAEMGKLQDMADKSADVVSENSELRNRLSELQQEIDTLKPASPPVAPDAPKKPSWWDAILDLFRPAPQGTPVVNEKLALQANVSLRSMTNTPPPAVPPAQPPTNSPNESASEGAVPPPGAMSTNEVIPF